MGMVVYKGQVYGEGPTNIEINVKDISEIEMEGDKESGYKVKPNITEVDGVKNIAFDIPLGMIIGNAAIVGSDKSSFVIASKEAPVDIELSKGQRAVFGEGNNRIVAQGFRVIMAESTEDLKSKVTPEDLYTNWAGLRARNGSGDYGLYSPRHENDDNNAYLKITSKNISKKTFSVSPGYFYNVKGTGNIMQSFRDTYNISFIPKTFGICFASNRIDEAAGEYGRCMCIPYLVAFSEDDELYCIPFMYAEKVNSGGTTSYTEIYQIDTSTGNDYYIDFASQAEYDFAIGITNSYQYITFDEYNELRNQE